MPLLPGKSNIGPNIKELEKPSARAPQGRPYNQALAIALKTAGVAKRADGGEVSDSGFTGGLAGDTPGRADQVPASVPDGSHVVPADVVSAIGGGNTGAGLKHLGKLFPTPKTPRPAKVSIPAPKMPGPPHLLAPKIHMPAIKIPRMPMRADGGKTNKNVKVDLSDGEFVIHPEHVARIGEGDVERGHRAIDHWIMSTRHHDIEHRKHLPRPVGSQ